jgi:hypothetical protein
MGQIIGAHPLAVMIDENDGLYNWTDTLLCHTIEANAETLFHDCCRSAMTKYQDPNTRFLKNGLLRDSVDFAVLKAPNLTYFYDRIPNVFPGAKIVYMFRDIRDVVSSMMVLNEVPILDNQLRRILLSKDLLRMFPTELSLLKHDDNTVKPYIKMALVAKIKMSLTKPFQENGLDVINVKYEDLIAHPQHVVPHVLEKIGLPDTAECLHHNEVFQGVGPGGTHRGRPLDNKSKGKWNDSLTQQQGNEIWDVVGDFMEDLGYAK